MMRKFHIMFEGTNYWLTTDDIGPERVGFYTSFLVEAVDSEAAELEARTLLKARLSQYRVLNSTEDPPLIRVDSIEEVGAGHPSIPTGVTFFPDDGPN